MCIYTVKKQKIKKNFNEPTTSCAIPPNVPKLGVSGVKKIPQKPTKI